MAAIVRALWLAAERVKFSWNDRTLWKFFPGSTALLSCEAVNATNARAKAENTEQI